MQNPIFMEEGSCEESPPGSGGDKGVVELSMITQERAAEQCAAAHSSSLPASFPWVAGYSRCYPPGNRCLVRRRTFRQFGLVAASLPSQVAA